MKKLMVAILMGFMVVSSASFAGTLEDLKKYKDFPVTSEAPPAGSEMSNMQFVHMSSEPEHPMYVEQNDYVRWAAGKRCTWTGYDKGAAHVRISAGNNSYTMTFHCYK